MSVRYVLTCVALLTVNCLAAMPATPLTADILNHTEINASNLCENNACSAPLPMDTPQLGTAVNWVKDVTVADQLARAQNRLVFEMHLSGNFESEGFT